ncbi:FMN-dependent oxidoreductase (nitrilotriacetate monooxygenase family) [Kitasatospora sp. MAA4]|uniref:NtaA/DmoA family FMN-dependent monooxygenase n=1 Tax=Kitasatospora sp. MAA4 TaxID=3035093 RepID=UPI0024744C81|nr:NtaA/DmoA family FMN-dependent monooxygenase [Kitasatospora sp. MAA4]MDH6130920.1 FMN-dependent oxidoreductase (nitrilotriacetate monooxygenase family) [Kitasatospora sp. MAA4]
MNVGRRRVHLGVLFPVNPTTTVWKGGLPGSQIDFAAIAGLARTAQRGRFDYLLLADDLRLPERDGEVTEIGVAGRHDLLTIISAVAAVTDRLGLVATVNTTFNEPYDIARQLATVNHLSDGRVGWNAVTTSDAWIGQNFRRGGFLPHAQRYERAAEFVQLCRSIWRAGGTPDSVPLAHQGRHFHAEGHAATACDGIEPVLMQAGDSEQGREFAAAHAEVIYSRKKGRAGREFYADVKGRLARHGRDPGQLKIMPAITYVVGQSRADAEELARMRRLDIVTPEMAIYYLEELWGCDLSGYDPEGPLPDIDPDPDGSAFIAGRPTGADAQRRADRAAFLRQVAESRKLSIRQLVALVTDTKALAGTPADIATAMIEQVEADACDGYIIVPDQAPGGLDSFVEHVVPELQSRGVLPAEYESDTLRGNLGLPESTNRAR